MKGPKSTSHLWPIMKRVLQEDGRRYWPRYVLAILFLSISGACTALAAWIMKDVINDIFVARDRGAMMLIPLAIAGLFLVRGITIYFGEVTLSRVGNKIVSETQAKLYRHLLRQDAAFFKAYPSGDILTRVTVNAASLRDMLNQITLSLGRGSDYPDRPARCHVGQDTIMSIMVFAVGPLAFLALRRLTQRIQGVARKTYVTGADVISTVRDTVQGIDTVKSYQLEEHLEEKLGRSIDTMRRTNNRMAAIPASIAPLIEISRVRRLQGLSFTPAGVSPSREHRRVRFSLLSPLC